MRNLKSLKILLLAILLLCFNEKSLSQSNFNIDITWDTFYKLHPSGIERNFESSDFVDIIEEVNFIPVKKELDGNQQLL